MAWFVSVKQQVKLQVWPQLFVLSDRTGTSCGTMQRSESTTLVTLVQKRAAEEAFAVSIELDGYRYYDEDFIIGFAIVFNYDCAARQRALFAERVHLDDGRARERVDR